MEMTPIKKQALKIQNGGVGSSCTISPAKVGTHGITPLSIDGKISRSKMFITWMAISSVAQLPFCWWDVLLSDTAHLNGISWIILTMMGSTASDSSTSWGLRKVNAVLFPGKKSVRPLLVFISIFLRRFWLAQGGTCWL